MYERNELVYQVLEANGLGLGGAAYLGDILLLLSQSANLIAKARPSPF